MSEELNRKIARRIIESGLSKHDLSLIDEYFEPDFIENQFMLKPSIQGMKESFETLYRAFPDYRLVIEDMASENDRVWLRMTCTGTNTGGFMGVKNGKPFKITVFDLIRFKNGKVVEHWGCPDRFHLLLQIGLLSDPSEKI
ncbi:MAG: ester cyclase [Chloroflexota bacterium]